MVAVGGAPEIRTSLEVAGARRPTAGPLLRSRSATDGSHLGDGSRERKGSALAALATHYGPTTRRPSSRRPITPRADPSTGSSASTALQRRAARGPRDVFVSGGRWGSNTPSSHTGCAARVANRGDHHGAQGRPRLWRRHAPHYLPCSTWAGRHVHGSGRCVATKIPKSGRVRIQPKWILCSAD